jgi:hypothetical protein
MDIEHSRVHDVAVIEEETLLATTDHFPRELPPGFTFVEGEPEFDASKHLALEMPDRIVTMKDLGYTDAETGQFPSPIAAAGPVRILSDEGVAALEQAIEATRPRMVPSPAGDPRLYFGSYHSRFMRDLTFAPELTDFLSELFQAPIAAHTMGALGIQLNIGEQPQAEILPWHDDRTSFTAVISMYDPTKVDGGRFEYFLGTREEGRQILKEQGELPADRVEAPTCPPGYGAFIQGTAVYHRAAPLRSAGYRASFLLSFCHRDASYPDLNDDRTYFTDQRERLGVESDVNPVFTEWARHNAWLAQARLGTLMDELPWTNDTQYIADQMRLAIAPIEEAIVRLERGVITLDEWRKRRDSGYKEKENETQMTTPRFAPGGTTSVASA